MEKYYYPSACMHEKIIVVVLSVCLIVSLLTVNLEGCCIITIKTEMNLKIFLSPFRVPLEFQSCSLEQAKKLYHTSAPSDHYLTYAS